MSANTQAIARAGWIYNAFSGGNPRVAAVDPALIGTVLVFKASANSLDGTYSWHVGSSVVSMTVAGGLITAASATGGYLPGSGGAFSATPNSTSYTHGNNAVGYNGTFNPVGATYCDGFTLTTFDCTASPNTWSNTGSACVYGTGCISGGSVAQSQPPVDNPSPIGGAAAAAIPTGATLNTVFVTTPSPNMGTSSVICANSGTPNISTVNGTNTITFYPPSSTNPGQPDIPPADVPQQAFQITNTNSRTANACYILNGVTTCIGSIDPGQTLNISIPALPNLNIQLYFTQTPCYQFCDPVYATPVQTPPTYDPNQANGGNPVASVSVPPFPNDPDPTPKPQPTPQPGGNEENFQGCISNPCVLPYLYPYQSSP